MSTTATTAQVDYIRSLQAQLRPADLVEFSGIVTLQAITERASYSEDGFAKSWPGHVGLRPIAAMWAAARAANRSLPLAERLAANESVDAAALTGMLALYTTAQTTDPATLTQPEASRLIDTLKGH